jgi:hypothetical protein
MATSPIFHKRIYIIKQIQRYIHKQEMHFLKDKVLIAEELGLKGKQWNLTKFFSVRLRNKRGDKDQLSAKVEDYEQKCYYLLKINSFLYNNLKFSLAWI